MIQWFFDIFFWILMHHLTIQFYGHYGQLSCRHKNPILGSPRSWLKNRLLQTAAKETQTDQSEKAASSDQQPTDQVLRWQLLHVAHTFRNSKRSDEGTNTLGMSKKMKAIQWKLAHCPIIWPGLCIAGHPSSMRAQQHLLPAGSQRK